MKKMNTIFLASGNSHKIEELQQILNPLAIQLKSTLDFPNAPEVIEDKPDLHGNALKKAQFWHHKTGLPSLADDTGLEVDALNGAPGVYSARYAGEDATYDDNVNKLLSEMAGITDRKARFRTVISYTYGHEQLFFEGICEGKITSERKGNKGFGYDPVFLPDGYRKTFAELNSEEKNRISHRRKALQQFLDYLSEKKPTGTE